MNDIAARDLDSSKQILNEFLDRWLELCAKRRLRAKSFRDYEGLLRRYMRPVLGTKELATWTETYRLARLVIPTLY